MKLFLFPIALLLPALAHAQSTQPRFTMEWPLRCLPNVNCFVDRYPDLNAGADLAKATEYGCGGRTQTGQTATEVIFQDQKSAIGQSVVAAAPGRVILVQNKVSDTKHMHPEGKYACGNEVRIRHINNYETRYCHMQKGSVTVDAGQVVAAGTLLGKTGRSGATIVPKFSFEVFKDGQEVDPFSNQLLDTPKPCFSGRDRSLWHTPIPYLPAGVMSSGFARAIPRPYEVEKDIASGQDFLTPKAHQIAAWVRVYGVKSGDEELFRILTPDDKEWTKRKKTYGTNFPYWFTGISAQAAAGLKPGRWQAQYTLTREGEKVLEHAFFVEIQPEEVPEADAVSATTAPSEPDPHADPHKEEVHH